MPLPAPIYPPYRPESFVSNKFDKAPRGAEIFALYHPATLQQQLYQAFLQDEQMQAASESERIQQLRTERNRILENLSSFRQTGLGPTGSAGGRTTRGLSSGMSADAGDLAGLVASEVKRLIAARETNLKDATAIDDLYKPVPGHQLFNTRLEVKYDERSGFTRPKNLVELAFDIANTATKDLPSLVGGVKIADSSRRAAAVSLYNTVYKHYGRALENAVATGNANQALDVLQAIDQAYGTNGFLENAIRAGMHPTAMLEQDKNSMRQAVVRGIAPGPLETKAQGIDFNGDGIISKTERERAQREAAGFAEPLSDEEMVFLNRYMVALKDDGVATPEELGADYEAAAAAYDKARRVENLPRGYAPLFDESYLRNLQELSSLDEQLSNIPARSPASQRAARRALGMPVEPPGQQRLPPVPPEAIAAAAAVHPILGEVLPYTAQRFQRAAGDVQPETAVEQFVENVRRSQRSRDVPGLIDMLDKKYQNNPDAKREALAYYGAANYSDDVRKQTLNAGALTGNPVKAASARNEFMRAIESPSPPPPTAAPLVGAVADQQPAMPMATAVPMPGATVLPAARPSMTQPLYVAPAQAPVASGMTMPPDALYPGDPVSSLQGGLYSGDPLHRQPVMRMPEMAIQAPATQTSLVGDPYAAPGAILHAPPVPLEVYFQRRMQ